MSASVLDSLPSIAAIGLFSAASVMVAISPGPTWMYVIAATTGAGGRRQGLIATLGNILGIGVHVVLAAGGISLIVASHGFLLEVLKYVGGGYLLYLGVKKIRQARTIRSFESDVKQGSDAKPESDRRVFFSSALRAIGESSFRPR
jgi:threonine/homoserine/homoserine lactone efflux protein